MHAFDSLTNRQTYRRTLTDSYSSLYRVCIACSAVIIDLAISRGFSILWKPV